MKPCLHLQSCTTGACCKIGVTPTKCPCHSFQQKLSYQTGAQQAADIKGLRPTTTIFNTVSSTAEIAALAKIQITGNCNCGRNR